MSDALIGLGVATTIGGGILGRKSAKSAGKAAARYSRYQAKINAIADKEQMRRMALNTSRLKGSQRASRAKSGVTVDGTPAILMQETAELAAIDKGFAMWQFQENQKLLAMRARAAKKGANIQADAVGLQALGSAVSILSNAYGSGE